MLDVHIELNKQIVGLDTTSRLSRLSISKLCALIAASSARFDHINVETAICKALSVWQADAPQGEVATAMQTLEMCALEKMEDLGPRQVASKVHILAKKCHCCCNHNFLAQLDAKVEALARNATRKSWPTSCGRTQRWGGNRGWGCLRSSTLGWRRWR